ncbi:MAG: Ig-like domain-containing protein [Lachnospiraceae bacterium]|nr:Ig-like domain-containing protein [Lachnospiraceae bacterium]
MKKMQGTSVTIGENRKSAGRLAAGLFGIMLLTMLMFLSPCMAGRVYAARPTIYVGGVALEDGYTRSIGGGTASYNSGVLTLTNISTSDCYKFDPYGDYYAGIYCLGPKQNLTIKLVGNNTINTNITKGGVSGIRKTAEGNIIITGSGSLTISNSGSGIASYAGISNGYGDLIIGDASNAPTITINGSAVNSGIDTFGVAAKHIEVKGGTLTAAGVKAIRAFDSLTVSGSGRVIATGVSSRSDSYGIENNYGSLILTVSGNGRVTAKGNKQAIKAKTVTSSNTIAGSVSYDGDNIAVADSYNSGWRYADLGRKDLSKATVTPTNTSYEYKKYTGETVTQQVRVKYGDDIIYSDTSTYSNKGYRFVNNSNKAVNAGNYTLTIEGINDYIGRRSVPWTIFKATPEKADFNTVATTTFTYDGSRKSVEKPTLKGSKSGCGTITLKYYKDGALTDPINGGDYDVRFDVEEGPNYKAAQDVPYGTLTIDKADNPANIAKTVSVRTNSSIDLSTLVIKGKATGEALYSMPKPYPTGCTKDGSNFSAGSETGIATVTIAVKGDSNYKAIIRTVTVYVTDKTIQNPSFTEKELEKTYGDAPFTNIVENAFTDVTYEVIDGDDVVSVDNSAGNKGKVTIKKPGVATIQATAKGTDTYAEASAIYSVSVKRKDVTVKANDITIKQGAAEPELSATVTGLVRGDKLDYRIFREEGTEPGEYAIIPSGDMEQGSYSVSYVNGTLTITSHKEVKGVSISPDTQTIELGKPVTLKPVFDPVDADNKQVSWKSDNPAVATVDKNGTVTGKTEGIAAITVTTADGGYKATCLVTVIDTTPKMELSSNKINIRAKKTNKLVKVNLAHDTIKSVTSSDASSKKKKIDSVSVNGDTLVIKVGKYTGSATITVTSRSGITKQLKVVVKKDKVTTKTLKLKPKSTKITLNGVGAFAPYQATASPDYYSTGEKVKVTSGKKSVVTVNDLDPFTGKFTLTAVGKGTAKVTVSAGKKKATINVTVKAPVHVKNVSLNKKSANLKVKQTLNLKATLSPKNVDKDKTGVTWTSSNPSVVKITKKNKLNCTVKAVSPGEATIKVTTKDGGFSKECTINVKAK